MRSVALLIVRAVVGGLVAGHGAQKLFAWYGGGGPRGTARFLRSLRIRDADSLAYVAGGSEFGGGLLTALGLLNPLGPIAASGVMLTAMRTAHRGRPIWVTSGGAELPVTNLAVLAALAVAGPGRISLDTLLGVKVPLWLSVLALLAVATGVSLAEPMPQLESPAAMRARDAERARAGEEDAGATLEDVQAT